MSPTFHVMEHSTQTGSLKQELVLETETELIQERVRAIKCYAVIAAQGARKTRGEDASMSLCDGESLRVQET